MSADAHAPSSLSRYRIQILIIGIFYFIFGIVTWANGTLIPYLTIACDLKAEWQAYLVTFAFYISYTVLALPSGYILRRTGMVRGMQLGLLVMALGCLVFVPAATTRNFLYFLSGLFVIGAGLTILQTAVNPYVTILGPPERAAQRMSLMGVCNKVAGMLAPLILGAIVFSNASTLQEQLSTLAGAERTALLDELAGKVILPYIVLSGSLVVIAFLLRFAHLPELVPPGGNELADQGGDRGIRQYPALSLGFLAIFFSVGVEVIAGDSIGLYGRHHGYPLEVAGRLTTFTLFSMTAGYFAGVLSIPKFISQERAFFWSNLLGIVLTLLVLLVPGKGSVFCLAAMGFTIAILWPAIWPAAMRGLPPRLVNLVSAILIMGIAGGALMPLLYGGLSTVWGRQMAYLILLPGFFFNLYYWKRCMR